MRVFATIAFSALSFSSIAMAAPVSDAGYWTFEEVVPSSQISPHSFSWANHFAVDEVPNIDIDTIVNVGKLVWKIVEAGKPVLNTRLDFATALPAGASPVDMENWQNPVAHKYCAKYNNMFNAEVVKYCFTVTAIWGGSYDGKGQYLAEVKVFPNEIDVSWGYSFSSEVAQVTTCNAGSREAPVAALTLQHKWSVTTPLKTNAMSQMFYVRGDGSITNVQ